MILDDVNLTELLLMAQDHNPDAHRGLPVGVLRRMAMGEETNLPQRPVDKIRLQIMEYIDRNWEQVQPLVQGCPARTRDLRACFRCTDVQAMECALDNPSIFDRSKKE